MVGENSCEDEKNCHTTQILYGDYKSRSEPIEKRAIEKCRWEENAAEEEIER